jgi:hypothetical protein
MKRIIVLCPYSGTKTQQEYRFNIVSKYAGDLIQKGHVVFSPITHCHPIAKIAGLPGDFDFWQKYSEEFTRWAQEGHVLCLEGWLQSIGVNAEISLLGQMRKPILYVNPDGTPHEQATR